ncbi:hypothetical protein HN873_017518 [Arachis hypogaea]
MAEFVDHNCSPCSSCDRGLRYRRLSFLVRMMKEEADQQDAVLDSELLWEVERYAWGSRLIEDDMTQGESHFNLIS